MIRRSFLKKLFFHENTTFSSKDNEKTKLIIPKSEIELRVWNEQVHYAMRNQLYQVAYLPALRYFASKGSGNVHD